MTNSRCVASGLAPSRTDDDVAAVVVVVIVDVVVVVFVVIVHLDHLMIR